jgi:hypothetical protein
MIKEHFERNKRVYWISSLVVVAGVTCVIMRGRYVGVPRVPNVITIRPLTFFSNKTKNIVNVFVRDGRGHPGYMIADLDTGIIYPSQYEAARALNASPGVVSGHLRGKLSDVHGHHLERVMS